MTQYLLNLYHKYDKETLMLIIMIVSIIPLVIVIRTVIFSIIRNYIDKRHHDYEKTFKKYSIYTYLLHTLLSLYLMFWGNILQAFPTPYWIISIKNIVITLYTGSFVTLLTLSLIEAFADIYRHKLSTSVQAYLSLYIQILRIVITSVAVIVIVSNILHISLKTFFTSLGAAAALLTFVFKDTAIGLLASVQLISQDIIRIGDLISIGQYNVEGVVEKITLTVVKIKNADQTISTIPTSNLLTTNVVNYRGITESSAKKIQRAIYIDINSIEFVPNTFIEELKKSSYLLTEAINQINLDTTDKDVTNVKIFRLYVKEYLKNHSAIHQQNFTFLVRELAPTLNNGLPIELYVFTPEMKADIYEDIQADIFDHLFAAIPEFKLKIFQNK